MCVDHLESVFHFLHFSLPLDFIFRDLQDVGAIQKSLVKIKRKYFSMLYLHNNLNRTFNQFIKATDHLSKTNDFYFITKIIFIQKTKAYGIII